MCLKSPPHLTKLLRKAGTELCQAQLKLASSLYCFRLTLSCMGGGLLGPPLSENRDFSGTKPPLDLRPVCKFKFVHCGPVEKNQSTLSFSV